MGQSTDRLSMTVGAYAVHLLHDGVYSMPIDKLLHADGESACRAAAARWGKPELTFDVNCFALAGPGGVTLVDTGSGELDGPECGKAEHALSRAGFTREQVSHVLLTHIHSDHIGGLFDGDSARYPNAVVHVPRGDLAFYADDPAGVPEWKRGSVANLGRLRWLYDGRVRSFDPGAVLPGIEAIALQGHTPGHSGFLLRDGNATLLMWGDVVHVEDLQLADPAVGFTYDVDLLAAQQSRRAVMDRAAREGWMVGGAHLSGIAGIERRGDAFALVKRGASL